MATPRLSLVNHLAIYHAFHRNRVNRLMHVLATPVIMFTGEILVSFVRFTPDTHWLHLGTLGALIVGASMLWLDLFGGLTVLAWLLPLNGPAAMISDLGWPAAVGALALHGLAWFSIVIVGHLRFEGPDSNRYFHRGYNWCSNLGVPVTFLDRFAQYNIGIVHPSYELAFVLGFKKKLKAQVDTRIASILERLSLALSPLRADT